MPWIIGGLSLAGDLVGGLFGSSSAKQANRTNIKMQREQRAWEKEMSDTAVQRRVLDLTKAGGNPALAFTGGQSASTPSVGAPTVEPTFRPEWTKGSLGTAALTAAQLDQVKAQTQNVSADTRKKNIEAQIMEEITGPSSAADYEAKVKKNTLWDQEFRKAIADADICEQTASLLKEKGPLVLRLLEKQGDLASIDAASAAQIQQALGVRGQDANTFLNILKTAAAALLRK